MCSFADGPKESTSPLMLPAMGKSLVVNPWNWQSGRTHKHRRKEQKPASIAGSGYQKESVHDRAMKGEKSFGTGKQGVTTHTIPLRIGDVSRKLIKPTDKPTIKTKQGKALKPTKF